MKDQNLILEQPSKHSFDKTIDLLVEKAQQKSWNVPAVHDLQQSLAKSGKTVKPVKVIEICKPEFSGKMLELNHERIMSIMMPCRISVYQKDDGNIYVALLNMEKMAGELPEQMAQVMKMAADEVQGIVDEVMA